MQTINFTKREPIGSSTFPMPNDVVDFKKTMSILGKANVDTKQISAMYIHIPFCDQICSFCIFNRQVSPGELKAKYVEALMKELEMYGKMNYIKSLKVCAIYIGGGTPNCLTSKQLCAILKTIKMHIPLTKNCEITCEGVPHNFTDEILNGLVENGVNRISMGVQTFNKSIRTEHLLMNQSKEDVIACIERVKANVPNFNIDMIYNLPNQTNEIWEDDLETAISCGSKHLTIYPLVLLEKARLYSQYVKMNKCPIPDQEKEIRLFKYTVERLKKTRFTNQYSVRDWAEPVYNCKYIQLSAEYTDILGIGAGAHGYLSNYTYRNAGSPSEYISLVRDSKELPLAAQRFCTLEEAMRRYLVMGLRLSEIALEPFEKMFKKKLRDVFEKEIGLLEKSGYIEVDDNRIKFTDKGNIWSNNVRTFFENDVLECTDEYYASITRVKASGDWTWANRTPETKCQ